jgi:DNA adenine methylase
MTNKIAKPFLKWAGGKTQLINDIEKALPKNISRDKFTYIEPFVGSGAVLFWMLNNFPKLEKAVINDINEDLINTYRIIATKPKELISILQNGYYNLDEKEEEKKELGVPLSGRAFRSNLLFVPHKRISTSIPNAKLAA